MTAPTLVGVEGFEHQSDNAAAGRVFSTYNNPTKLSYVAGRLGGYALKVIEDGATATYAERTFAAASKDFDIAGWFKMAAAPASASSILRVATAGSTAAILQVETDGTLTCRSGATGPNSGINVCDGAWHLVELKLNTNPNPRTVDWRINGVAQTQATQSVVSATMTLLQWGSVTAADTATVTWDDMLVSNTAADFDSKNWTSNYAVLASYPNAEGTDVLGTTNAIVNEVGGNTSLYTKVDDLATGAANTSDYITYSSITTGDAASNYAEVAMGNAGGATIWGVDAVGITFAGSAAANVMICRAVDAAGTGIGDFSTGSTGATTLIYKHLFLTTPANGWTADFDGCKVRIGFSTDTNPLPRCSAIVFQYAVPVAGEAEFMGVIPI
jgi:hypothetical protein